MRVKCVDDRSSCFVYCGELKKGKEYEVLESRSKMYLLNNDLGYEKWYYEYRFEIIKEDRMEEIRVVRKLKDLDGLENGMGAIAVYDEVNKRVRIRTKEECLGIGIAHSDEYSDLDGFLTVMKATGFKFKYKPLRTVEDVRTEMSLKCKEFEFNGDNYCLNYVKLYNRYHTHQDCFNNILGALYFDKETADKYCNELNEILKNK